MHSNAFDFYDLKKFDPTILSANLLSVELISHHRVIPINKIADTLQIGISDPANDAALEAIRFHTSLRVQAFLVDETLLTTLIHAHCQKNIFYEQLETTLHKMLTVQEPSREQENADIVDEPVIEFVNQLIEKAINNAISDIHIEPFAEHYRIRFRHNGMLQDIATVPNTLAARMATRLKIMANLNIAERRLPQDGHIAFMHEHKIDIRLNTCPTIHGEKVVLRLLDVLRLSLDINRLGMTPSQEAIFSEKLSAPQGLILVTGPTGSGKTMTLYTALTFLNRIEKNILTVEDPVEIELPGINQVNIHPAIGLDFATVLRTFLRQDPDTIMIGEIRDEETAAIAMHAAETGHLVLSTLHTNSAIATLMRLHSLKVSLYHLTHAISLIIAQRLVRKLCVHCKTPDNLINLTQQSSTVYRAVGCQFCHQGYQGRIGVFECLTFTPELISLIQNNLREDTILAAIDKTAWVSLWESGLQLVLSGLTSYAELTRVLGKQHDVTI